MKLIHGVEAFEDAQFERLVRQRDRLLEACKAFYAAMNSDEQVGELMKAYKVAADAIALAEGGEEK